MRPWRKARAYSWSCTHVAEAAAARVCRHGEKGALTSTRREKRQALARSPAQVMHRLCCASCTYRWTSGTNVRVGQPCVRRLHPARGVHPRLPRSASNTSQSLLALGGGSVLACQADAVGLSGELVSESAAAGKVGVNSLELSRHKAHAEAQRVVSSGARQLNRLNRPTQTTHTMNRSL